MTRFATLVVCLGLGLLACAPSQRELRDPVDADLARRLGSALDPRTKLSIDAVLAEPLDAQAAIRIAIANNARLAAAFDELGIAGGGLGAALGLGATEVHASLRFGDHTQLEIDVVQNVLGLITGAHRRAAARSEVRAVQAMAAAATLRLAARVEMAFTDLLAAQQTVELRRTAFEVADAAALVRERMYGAGNTTDLAQARDRDAREQARIALARAEAKVETRREVVNALLGLSGAQTGWTARGTLPELGPAAPQLDSLEQTAVAASLELAAGRARGDAAANLAADARLRSVLPELGVGVSVHDDSEGMSIGPVVQIGLPLLDWNSGGRAMANARARKARHELTATAIELRASARSARITALATFQEARHLGSVVLPLRHQIVEETLKHYNAMNADPFALLLARRELVDAGEQHLDALRRHRDAMIAVTALQRGVAIDAPESEAGAAMPSAPTSAHGGHK